MEYKFVELLSLDFMRSTDDVVRAQISYRYNAMKSRLALMQSRLHDVNSLIKVKNPSLLLAIQKGNVGSGSSSSHGQLKTPKKT
jgi:hypothetical protein